MRRTLIQALTPIGLTAPKLAVVGLGVILLAGCATVFGSKYAFADGWRRGGVVSVVPGSELERPAYWRCTRDLPANAVQQKKYVLMWYAEPGWKSYTVAEAIGNAVELRKGDPVYVNVWDCGRSPVARVVAAR